MRRHGFTLIEIAIVLVVIGLVIGGVIGGQALIREAQLRSVLTGLTSYATSYDNFRTKYHAVPGDMATAGSIIPNASNGNGDGLLYNTNTAITAANGEDIKAWQHLSFSGMVPFKFTAAGFGIPHVLGTQQPRGAFDSTGYRFESIPNWEGSSTTSIYGNLGTTLRLEGFVGTNTNAGVINTAEAMSLDKKIDDGIPTNGSFITFRGFGNAFSDCVTGSTGWTDPGSRTYNLATTDNKCVPALFVDKP